MNIKYVLVIPGVFEWEAIKMAKAVKAKILDGVISIKMTGASLKKLKEKAKKAELPHTVYARNLLLEGMEKTRSFVPHLPERNHVMWKEFFEMRMWMQEVHRAITENSPTSRLPELSMIYDRAEKILLDLQKGVLGLYEVGNGDGNEGSMEEFSEEDREEEENFQFLEDEKGLE